MGSIVPKFCTDCFVGNDVLYDQEMENPLLQEVPVKSRSKSKKSSFEMIDTSEPLPQDQEYLLRLVEAASLEFLNHLSEEEALEHVVSKNGVSVYSGDSADGYIIKAVWKVPFSPQEFISFVRNTQHRKNWDKKIEEIKVVEEPLPDLKIIYSKYKKMMMVSQRDAVTVNKSLYMNKGSLLVGTSCEHPSCPPSKDVIRAKIDVSGYYAEPIEPDSEGNTTKVVNLIIGSFGGKLPKKMIKKVMASSLPKFAQTLNQEIQKSLN